MLTLASSRLIRTVERYRPYIGKGNTKLGAFHTWSIPPGRAHCPGETAACASVCYAKRGHYYVTHVQDGLHRNYAFSKTKAFVPWVNAQIVAMEITRLRIHVAGDFYSAEYTSKWRQIVKHNPGTLFLAYTRSWRIPEIREELLKLARHKNIRLWFSADRDAPPVREWKRVRWAYMAMDDEDGEEAARKYPGIQLMFRVRHHSPRRRLGGVIVCPPENGIAVRQRITCERCGLCWDPRKPSPETLKR